VLDGSIRDAVDKVGGESITIVHSQWHVVRDGNEGFDVDVVTPRVTSGAGRGRRCADRAAA
jgi:hypothetical protein